MGDGARGRSRSRTTAPQHAAPIPGALPIGLSRVVLRATCGSARAEPEPASDGGPETAGSRSHQQRGFRSRATAFTPQRSHGILSAGAPFHGFAIAITSYCFSV
jgi:hypothetical protein